MAEWWRETIVSKTCASLRKCSIKSRQLISFPSSSSSLRGRSEAGLIYKAKKWEPTVIRGVFSSKTFRRPLIAVGWGSAVWPGCIKDAWALSVGCATYLFFHYAQTLTRDSLRCAREQNQEWRDEKDDGAEDVRSIFFPSAQLFLFGGGLAALTEKLIKSRRGVSDAANCGTVRCCGPTPKPGPFITCPPEGGWTYYTTCQRLTTKCRSCRWPCCPCSIRFFSFFSFRPALVIKKNYFPSHSLRFPIYMNAP
jgi:hypothetical protein